LKDWGPRSVRCYTLEALLKICVIDNSDLDPSGGIGSHDGRPVIAEVESAGRAA
jgi:hypothetical protein